MANTKSPREAALELVKALKTDLDKAKSGYSPQEVVTEMAKALRDEISKYETELVKMRQKEAEGLKKSLHGLPSETPSHSQVRSVFDVMKSGSAPTMKAEDFIDLKNANDREKRIKTIGGKDTVVPGDKKIEEIDAEGSGGDVKKLNKEVMPATSNKMADLKAQSVKTNSAVDKMNASVNKLSTKLGSNAPPVMKEAMDGTKPAAPAAPSATPQASALKPAGVPGAKAGDAPKAPKPPSAPGSVGSAMKSEAGSDDLQKSVFDILRGGKKNDVIGAQLGTGQFLSPETVAAGKQLNQQRNAPTSPQKGQFQGLLDEAAAASAGPHGTQILNKMPAKVAQAPVTGPTGTALHQAVPTAVRQSTRVGPQVPPDQEVTQPNFVMPTDMHGRTHPEGVHAGWPKGTETWAKSEKSVFDILSKAVPTMQRDLKTAMMHDKNAAPPVMPGAAPQPKAKLPTMEQHAQRANQFSDFMPPGKFGKEELDDGEPNRDTKEYEKCAKCKESLKVLSTGKLATHDCKVK